MRLLRVRGMRSRGGGTGTFRGARDVQGYGAAALDADTEHAGARGRRPECLHAEGGYGLLCGYPEGASAEGCGRADGYRLP